MNPIEITKKIKEVAGRFGYDSQTSFTALIYYNEYKEAVWMESEILPDEVKKDSKNYSEYVLKERLSFDQGGEHNTFYDTKTDLYFCVMKWTNGLVVLSGYPNPECIKILRISLQELKIYS